MTMIEENSDDDFGTDEGVEKASDSVPETDQEGSSDSLLPFPEGASGTDPEDEEEDISPTEKRREKRRRQRIMEGLAESFGLEGDEAMETLSICSRSSTTCFRTPCGCPLRCMWGSVSSMR